MYCKVKKKKYQTKKRQHVQLPRLGFIFGAYYYLTGTSMIAMHVFWLKFTYM